MKRDDMLETICYTANNITILIAIFWHELVANPFSEVLLFGSSSLLVCVFGILNFSLGLSRSQEISNQAFKQFMGDIILSLEKKQTPSIH